MDFFRCGGVWWRPVTAHIDDEDNFLRPVLGRGTTASSSSTRLTLLTSLNGPPPVGDVEEGEGANAATDSVVERGWKVATLSSPPCSGDDVNSLLEEAPSNVDVDAAPPNPLRDAMDRSFKSFR